MSATTDSVRHLHYTADEARLLVENNITPKENTITCYVYKENQSLADGVRTTMSFSTQLWDTDDMWAIGDPTKIYVNRNGLYLIAAWVTFQSHATMGRYREHLVFINGVRESHLEQRKENDINHWYTFCRSYMFTKGDYAEFKMGHNAGVSLLGSMRVAITRIAK